jgi:hypothetical protein
MVQTFGLVILTCHLMEAGKVVRIMAGLQDALHCTLIGMQLVRNQIIQAIMKIVQ